MNRRDIIKVGMSSVAVSMLPASFINAADTPLDVDQSLAGPSNTLVKHGHPMADKLFIWSVMKVKDEEVLLSTIETILTKYNYRSAIKYASSDKFKVAPAKQIIDAVMSDKNVSFDITVFKGDPNGFRNQSPLEFNSKMENLYKKALPSGLGESISSKVEDRYGPSEKYNEKFQNAHGVANSVKNAKFDKIIQVNDLFSGIIFSIFAGELIQSKVKLELKNYLSTKVTLNRNGGSFNSGRIKIKNIIL